MAEPVSTSALLYATAKALATGAVSAAGRGIAEKALDALKRRRIAGRAIRAAAARFPYPGLKRALHAWRKSPEFANLVGRAEAGDIGSLSDDRIASSFIEVSPGLGWGSAAESRARAVTRAFLERLFDELVKGPDGPAVQRRIEEAHHAESQAERAAIQSSLDGGLRGIESKVGDLDRKMDEIKKSEDLTPAVRAALEQPVFDELSKLLRAGDAQAALDFATRHTEALDAAMANAADAESAARTERIESALRPHRQRLLFAAATASGWLGDVGGGRALCRRALRLGPVTPEWQDQAAVAMFNTGLTAELRDLIPEMELESKGRRLSEALLATLDGEWGRVSDLLSDEKGPDLLLLRAQAHVHLLDPTNPDAVRGVADLLEETDAEGTLPRLVIQRARVTHALVRRVVDGRTPLSFERGRLIQELVRRTDEALGATDPNSLLRVEALSVVGAVAILLRDDPLRATHDAGVEAIDEPLRSASIVPHSPPPPPEEIDDLEKEGRLSRYEAATLKAAYFDGQRQPEEAERVLREALFTTPEEHERGAMLRVLVRWLGGQGRVDEAISLVDSVPVSEATKWLLKAQVSGSGPDYDEAEAYPLDASVLEWVASMALRDLAEVGKLAHDEVGGYDQSDTALDTGADAGEVTEGGAGGIVPADSGHPSGVPPNGDARDAVRVARERAVLWTARYAATLPTRSARLMHAEALYLSGDYAALLDAVEDTGVFDDTGDPYGERAAELRAWALDGLGRRTEAANFLAGAARARPASERLAVNASALLLEDDRPSEAAELLAPHLDAETESPGVLVNSARALLVQAPDDREKASRAFDLLQRAFDVEPSAAIAAEAWKAARGAGREREASRYFMAMVGDAPEIEIESAEDLDKALASIGHRLVRFKGGLEAMAERIAKQREGTEALNRLAGAQVLAYADLFRVAGGPWEHWAQWTERFQRAAHDNRAFVGAFSVLADWPSRSATYNRQHNEVGSGAVGRLYADLTALLTLGVLGTERAEQILDALGVVAVERGALDGLREDLSRIESNVLIGSALPYAEAAHLVRDAPAVVVPYDEDLERAAPDEQVLGASRVDIGAALMLGGRYVTQRDGTEGWPEEVAAIALSPAALLSSLNAAGRVSSDQAREAAARNSSAFADWELTTSPPPLPDALVFDPFVLLDWVDAGLFDAVRDRVRLGPWAWTHIATEADNQEALRLAHQRLRSVTDVLRAALERGVVVEVEPHGPSGDASDSDPEDPDAGDDPARDDSIETAWYSALRSLRTARKHDLQLWADDRFYPLLLWMGGPTLEGPSVDAVRGELAAWGEATPPLPTVEVVAGLAADGRVPHADAERIATALFEAGYRPAHPLTLRGILKQYRAPDSAPLPPPLATVAGSITGASAFLSDHVPAPKRDGFIRVASAQIAERLTTTSWTAPGLSEAQRRTLADAFLDAAEAVWRAHSPSPQAPRSERTALLFWGTLGVALRLLPGSDNESQRLRSEALRWLGEAVTRRTDDREAIVRILEDNALAAIALDVESTDLPEDLDLPEEAGASFKSEVMRRAMGAYAFSSLEPLFVPALLPVLDPLLRRTVGTLANATRGGRLDTSYRLDFEGTSVEITVPEEDGERAAADLIRHIMAGELSLVEMVHATDLVFEYARTPKPEWVKAGVPEEGKLPFTARCSLFTLLWVGDPDIREAVVSLLIYHLSILDPSLAHHVARLKDALIAEETAEEAMVELAVVVLQSGFFDLQRDLVHALWRFRSYDAEVFQQFIGWIGEEDALELVRAIRGIAGGNLPIHVLGSVVVPREHIFGRMLLSESLNDTPGVAQAARAMVSGGTTAGISLAEWLEDRASLAETTPDPFTAAWALRQFLVALVGSGEDPDVTVGGACQKASEWAASYVTTALTVGEGSTSPLEQHMTARRRLASSTLRLAAFACSGDARFEDFNQEDDPLKAWLDGVWLLATKLQVGLVGIKGGLSGAVATATSALRDLGLTTLGARVLDAFDPFAFGPEGDDIGTALTLTAMLSPLEDATDTPDWWKPTVRDAVEAIASREPDAQAQTAGDTGNRFDLSYPLRSRTLAAAVQAAMPPSSLFRPSDTRTL